MSIANQDTPPKDSQVAYIALGANLGNPLQQIDLATKAVASHPQINCLAMSRVYISKPHGDVEQGDFHNSVIKIETTLTPLALLDELQRIEIEQGRDRSETAQHWGPRMIDLDIILYSDITIKTDRLTIPHAFAHEREFVLMPLLDLDDNITIIEHGAAADLVKKLPTHTMETIRNVTTYHH